MSYTISKTRDVKWPSKTSLAGARYFILPFLIWTVLGGIFLLLEQERAIYKVVNDYHYPFLDTLLPYITRLGEGEVVVTGLLVLLIYPAFRTPRYLLALVCCNLVPFLLTQGVKSLVNAPRPLKYFQEAEWIKRVTGQPVNYDYSFPSGHSEGAFAFFCFLALILPPRYSYLGFFFFFLALLVGYSRIYLSQHFYADVYIGSLIGTGCCILMFWLIHPAKYTAASNA